MTTVPMHNKSYRNNDMQMMRLRALALVMQKTCRILMGDRRVVVNISDGNTADMATNSRTTPGWSAYPDIFINRDAFVDYHTTKTLVQLLGLVYHELSHLLFSPRRSTWIPPTHDFEAYNILEDQRIESFFTARYQPAGKYFTEMVVRFYVEREEMWTSAFALTYGRSFLPLEIRQEFEARFARPDLIDEMQYLIDKYKAFRTYHFKHKQSVVNAIIHRFQELLNDLQASTGQDELGDSKCSGAQQGGGTVDEDMEQEAQKRDKKRHDKEEKTGEDQSGFWEDEEDEAAEDRESGDEEGDSDSDSDDSEDDEDDGDGGESEPGTSGDEDSEADDDGADDSDSSEGDDDEGDSDGDESDEGSGDADGDADSDGVSGEGEVDGEEGSGGPGLSDSVFDDSEFFDYLEEIVDAVNEDDVVQNEVSTIKSALNEGVFDVEMLEFGQQPYTPQVPTPSMMQTLNRITQELRRIYAEVEPGWKYGSDLGRLNVQRAMDDPENYDEMFDEWDEGREQEVGLEAVISCDLSSSMGGTSIERASMALWTLKRALDDVDAKVTVLGFHQNSVGLYSRNDKANKSFWPEWRGLVGDTQPANSMKLARRILNNSRMPNKLFVIITDGGFGSVDYDEVVTPGDLHNIRGNYEDLRALTMSIDASKMYVGIGSSAANKIVSDQCDVVSTVNDPAALVPVAQALVTKMLRDRQRRG